ncbi:MAG: sulfite exporter TauE/SafE family protein [Actinobacteria bacterium]|nr:sulfite exporter TauE/SafE family protein [Actinomycetota bacterium]MCG2820207.1 sulfite exporter TauE/SafE family protein [Actinomycetes bacterium]MBU4219386.1 sulfite exporter TauE/SafE family protein [Actinomycetota bacterium]MBU4360073.1 sulfite exporter TauE/SafE family protein [Actinomycetota bacterium]MBU4393283.1 sulfite exporter TauE/SafE family protein [Actinomycetota bacterium]
MEKKHETRERVYYTDGMYCAACELIIEKKLLELGNVHSVEASIPKSSVLVEYENQAPSVSQLNKLFKPEGYSFTLSPPVTESGSRWEAFAKVAVAVVIAVGLIVLLQQAGLSKLVNVDSKSALPAFLILGLVAGFSSCAALVGGIVLSMSKQWSEIYSPDDPMQKRLEPHLMFNIGRLISFVGLGAVLALVGGSLRLTPTLSAILVLVISFVMIALGLQMLGVKFLKRFQFTMPKSITRYVADETHFKGRYMPFAMGALTFFVPCGFAITAQSFALLSGKPLQGSLIMLAFALGTLPMLLIIGFSSVKFLEKPRLATTFIKVAGVLVLIFALFNINNQLVVLNAPNLSDVSSPSSVAPGSANSSSQLPPIVDGKQILKMEATASGYNPNKLMARAGVPVKWEIRDTGTSSCTNAIISKDLFSGEIPLTPGKTSVKEFTPEDPGTYRFSCWMGMVTGTINVVNEGKQDTSKKLVVTEPEVEKARDESRPDQQDSVEAASGLPAIVDGKQVLKMEASSSGYKPDELKVRVDVPVRWEIRDTGTGGCTNAIKAVSLFPGEIQLKPGKTSIKDFTPNKLGRFRFSCWMGMVEGVIEVVDPNNPDQTKFEYDETTLPEPDGCPCCG